MGTMSYFSGHIFQSMRKTKHLQLTQSSRMRELYLYSLQNAFMENTVENAASFFRQVCKFIKKILQSSKLFPHRYTTCIPITTNYKERQFKQQLMTMVNPSMPASVHCKVKVSHNRLRWPKGFRVG
jgi:Zn-dependent M32 family carboxypeptidase